jgi:hypothetical protein
MKNLIMIILYGYVVLVAAILANLLANFFGLISWYDFLQKNYESLSLASIIWLFIFYPLVLGLAVYLILMLKNS